MAAIPTPKQGVIVKQEILTNTNTNTTKSFLLTTHESSNGWTLYIGGNPKIFCIDAFIPKEDSPFARFQDISVGLLSHIYYDEGCAFGSNFKRGVDTNLILKLLISYVKKEFPHIRAISFSDTSVRKCDNDINVVELAEPHYITSGKTWYQKHFGAYLADPDPFILADKEFQAKKSKISWEMMETFISTPYDEEDSQYFGEIYNNSTTWQDFFGTLQENIGISKLCTFTAPWLHTFLTSMMPFNFSNAKYLLPTLAYFPYNVEEYKKSVGGGSRRGKLTRKNYKSWIPRNYT